MVCGSEKAFPIPHPHCTAPSQHYSALNSSQAAAQNSTQELEQHFIIFLYPLVLYLSESTQASRQKKNPPRVFSPKHHSENSVSFESLFQTYCVIRYWEKQRQNSPLSIAGHGKSAGNWVSLCRNPQIQLCHPKSQK